MDSGLNAFTPTTLQCLRKFPETDIVKMSQSLDQKLEKFVREYGFTRPDRGDFQGKSKNHKVGSLEIAVENLVKKWEMEITHLPNTKDWTTVEVDKFCVQVNGGQGISGEEAARVGSYNWILKSASKDLYDAQAHTFESSHKLFRNTFVGGFAWEVLEVFSGPPKVAFTWRHWGVFNGEYNGSKGQNEVLELYGFTIASVSESMKIIKVEVYSKFNEFLRTLKGTLAPSELQKGKSLLGSCCPIYKPSNTKWDDVLSSDQLKCLR